MTARTLPWERYAAGVLAEPREAREAPPPREPAPCEWTTCEACRLPVRLSVCDVPRGWPRCVRLGGFAGGVELPRERWRR